MSKRFGRNQKRKMQEEISHMKEAVDMANGLTSFLYSKHREDTKTLRRVEEVLGNHNALLEPKVVDLGDESPIVKIESIETEPSSRFLPGDAIKDIDVHAHVLHTLNTSSKRDVARNCMHVEICWKNHRVGYAITDEAMTNLPTSYLIEQVSKEMAKLLIQEIKEA